MVEFVSLLQEGFSYYYQAQLPQARSLFSQILRQDPQQPDALNGLGLIAEAEKQFELALHHYRQVLQSHPHHAEANNNMAILLCQQGNYQEAIPHFKIIVQQAPHYLAYYNLALSLQHVGDNEEATQYCLKSLACNLDFAPAWHTWFSLVAAAQSESKILEQQSPSQFNRNSGLDYRFQGQLNKALNHLQQWVNLEPTCSEAHWFLAECYTQVGEKAQAQQSYKRVIALEPNNYKAYENVLQLLPRGGSEKDLFSYVYHCFRLHPCEENLFALVKLISPSLLVYLLPQTTSPDLDQQLIAGYQRRALPPALMLRTVVGLSEAELFSHIQQWARSLPEPLPPVAIKPSTTNPLLRIGYVSGDFVHHATNPMFMALFGHHNRQSFTIFAYSEVTSPDDQTQVFQTLADHWRSTVGLTTAEVIKQIQQDEIDILVDCSGHSQGNRLDVFARKPALIQLTGLGFFHTTGLAAIDYCLSDPWLVPEVQKSFYSEEIVYLPSILYWEPPQEAGIGSISTPRAIKHPIIFGSGNETFKLNATLIQVWATILKQVPNSKLFLKAKLLGDPLVQEMILKCFFQNGIGFERLHFQGGSSFYQHLQFYQQVDIVLDTFPYNGGITTCEALGMGAPVIILDGGTRTGVSILNQIGLPELIAKNVADYIQKAVSLAQNREHLQRLQLTVATRLLNSPICDKQSYVNAVENAYHTLWQRTVESRLPS